MSTEAVGKIRQLLDEARSLMLTSRAPDGHLHSRPLVVAELDDAGQFWFLVDRTASWVEGLSGSEHVNLAMAQSGEGAWLSVSGRTRTVEDRSRVAALWSAEVEAYLEDAEDPRALLLVVEAESAEYWESPTTGLNRIAAFGRYLATGEQSTPGRSRKLDLE